MAWELPDDSGEAITHAQIGLCLSVDAVTGQPLVSPRRIPTSKASTARRFGDAMTQTLPVTVEHRAVFQGFDPGSPLRFRVRVQNVNGWSEWSRPSVGVSTLPDVPASPAAPVVFITSTNAGTSISPAKNLHEPSKHDLTVVWRNSPNHHGAEVTAFQLQIRRGELGVFEPLVAIDALTGLTLEEAEAAKERLAEEDRQRREARGTYHERIEAVFVVLDVDKSGSLSWDELEDVFGDDADFYRKNMDGYVAEMNGDLPHIDGAVSKAEWVGFFEWSRGLGVGEKRLDETEDKAIEWVENRKHEAEESEIKKSDLSVRSVSASSV